MGEEEEEEEEVLLRHIVSLSYSARTSLLSVHFDKVQVGEQSSQGKKRLLGARWSGILVPNIYKSCLENQLPSTCRM
jgi:hypothetical protein